MSRKRKMLILVVFLLLLPATACLWLVATESGTRWLVSQLGPHLPARLELGNVSGSLLGGVAAERVQWRDAALSFDASGVSARIDLLPLLHRRVVVRSLDVDGLRVQSNKPGAGRHGKDSGPFRLPVDIAVRAASLRNIEFSREAFERRIDRLSLAGELVDDRIRVSSLELQSDWLGLGLSGTVAVRDNLPLELDAHWRWQGQEGQLFSGRLRASGDASAYDIHHELDAPLAVATEGTLAILGGALSADLTNTWQDLSWPFPQGNLHSSRGSIRVTGAPDRFDLQLEARAGFGAMPECGLRLAGDVRRTPEPTFDLEFDLDGVDPAVADQRLQGTLDAGGRIRIEFADAAATIDATLARLAGSVNGQPVDGRASVHYAGNTTTISDAYIALGDNTAKGNAVVAATIRVDANLELTDLAQLLPDMAGSLRGHVAAGGQASRPEVRFDLAGTHLAWRDLAVASLSARGDLPATGSGNAVVVIGEADIGGTRLDAVRMSVTGQPESHGIDATLQAFGTTLDVTARGRYGESTWSGILERVAVEQEDIGHWSARDPGELSVSPGTIEMQRLCLERAAGPGTACLSANRSVGVTTFDASVTGVPLAALAVALPAGLSVDGHIVAGLRGTLSADTVAIAGDLALQDASIGAAWDGEQLSLDIAAATATASIVDGRLEASARIELADDAGSANARLDIEDFGSSESPLDGRGEIRIRDAADFAVFLSSIQNPQGRVEGELTVGGTAGAPGFLGDIAIRDGAFDVRQTGIQVRDFNLVLSQSRPGELHLQGSARSGAGQLSMEGATRIGQDTGLRAEVSLRGENFELARLPDWQVSASPRITAIFDNHLTTVAGELAIPTARIVMKEVPESAQKPSRDTVVHGEDGGENDQANRRRIDLHLRTSLGDDVRFTGFGLTTGLEGAIQLRGGTHAPYTGQGRLDLVEGRYKAYGQELEIERGTLLFSGPLDDPMLDVRVVRRTTDVIAGIQLSGTPSRLRSEVFSEPPLDDAETLSYLLTGRPLSAATSAAEGDTLNQAAFALGLSGAGLVASQVRAELGLETLTITGSGDASRLVAGKRLGNKLLIEYGYGLVDKLGTLLLRYDLNDRIVLESRSGTISTLDILYRARKR